MPRLWTTEEERILREEYPKVGANALSVRLGRSRQTIIQYAHNRGLHVSAEARRRLARASGEASKRSPNFRRLTTADGLKGGAATRDRHGPDYYANMGKRSGESRRARLSWVVRGTASNREPFRMSDLLEFREWLKSV